MASKYIKKSIKLGGRLLDKEGRYNFTILERESLSWQRCVEVWVFLPLPIRSRVALCNKIYCNIKLAYLRLWNCICNWMILNWDGLPNEFSNDFHTSTIDSCPMTEGTISSKRDDKIQLTNSWSFLHHWRNVDEFLSRGGIDRSMKVCIWKQLIEEGCIWIVFSTLCS